MIRRHVRGDRSVMAAAIALRVRRNALTAQEYLDGRLRVAHIDLLAGMTVRDGVKVFVELDVVIDVFCGRPQKTSCVVQRFLWPLPC